VGFNTSAAGGNAFAGGNGAQAGGLNAVSLGNGSSANFSNSDAIGNGAAATKDNEFALGNSTNTFVASGITSAASLAAQTGKVSIVTTDASGHLAISPNGVICTESATANFECGTGAVANGNESTAVGQQAQATGFSSSAYGYNAVASGQFSGAFAENSL